MMRGGAGAVVDSQVGAGGGEYVSIVVLANVMGHSWATTLSLVLWEYR